MVSKFIDMSRFNDFTGIQIAIHRLAIDSVKISGAFFIYLPLHGRNVILYAGNSLFKVVFHSKSFSLFPYLIDLEKLPDMFFYKFHDLLFTIRFPVA